MCSLYNKNDSTSGLLIGFANIIRVVAQFGSSILEQINKTSADLWFDLDIYTESTSYHETMIDY